MGKKYLKTKENSLESSILGIWQEAAKKADELEEAKFSPKEIKMAIGVASDKRYAGGNMTGATKAIDKIKKGLSDHPAITLLHGKNFAGFYFDKIAKQLVAKGYRVIVPDQVGFGKSSKPKNYQYSFQQLALNTRKLIAHLNIDQYILVGHSMGGMLSVHLASMSDKVKQLVLVNPIGLEDYLKYVEYQDPEFFYEKEVVKTVDMFRNYQKKNYYDGKWNDSYEQLLEPFKGWQKGPDWELVAWNNALTYEPIFGDEIISKISSLKVPTYLILGTRDRTGPGRAWKKPGVSKELGLYQNLGKEVKALNPKRIKLIELKGLGHMPQFEDYTAFSKVFYPLF